MLVAKFILEYYQWVRIKWFLSKQIHMRVRLLRVLHLLTVLCKRGCIPELFRKSLLTSYTEKMWVLFLKKRFFLLKKVKITINDFSGSTPGTNIIFFREALYHVYRSCFNNPGYHYLHGRYGVIIYVYSNLTYACC